MFRYPNFRNGNNPGGQVTIADRYLNLLKDKGLKVPSEFKEGFGRVLVVTGRYGGVSGVLANAGFQVAEVNSLEGVDEYLTSLRPQVVVLDGECLSDRPADDRIVYDQLTDIPVVYVGPAKARRPAFEISFTVSEEWDREELVAQVLRACGFSRLGAFPPSEITDSMQQLSKEQQQVVLQMIEAVRFNKPGFLEVLTNLLRLAKEDAI